MEIVIRKNWQKILRVLALVVVLSSISVLVSNWLKTEIVQTKIVSLGFYGPFLVIFYIVISHLFAPLAGTPGTVTALSAFGLVNGIVLIYLAHVISAVSNFYIARIWGRKWVIKLAGRDSMENIDRFVEIMGTRLLVIARLFGFPLYEFVSYAAGLTTIPFSKYFLITCIVGLVPVVVLSPITFYTLTSPALLSLMLLFIILLGIVFTWYTTTLYLKLAKK